MRRMLLIFNPVTGGGRIKNKLAEILCLFSQAGYHLQVFPTKGPKHAIEITQNYGGDVDALVCCGGDGTLSEVVQGMMSLEKRPMLGYIPCGTTNDFSSALRLPKGRLLSAAQRIITPRKLLHLDIGRFNESFFTYVAAFGSFADIPYKTSQSNKNLFGHMAYLFEAVFSIGNMRPTRVKLSCEEGVYEDDFLFGVISNAVSVAGFSFPQWKNVRLDDGYFEVVLAKFPKNPVQMGEISAAVLSGNTACPLLTFLKAKELKVECATPLGWTLDGEYGGAHKVSNIQVKHKALDICI